MTLTIENHPPKLGIIGLGYVGLPLAVTFAHHFETIGYDTKTKRIHELQGGYDCSLEVSTEELKAASQLTYTDHFEDLRQCTVFIVTVPTPINEFKQPDFSPLENASRTLGQLIKPNDIVIYESTVYPGATEEVCVPLLEAISGLTFNQDFFVGYSPERINPGDQQHRLSTIKKITSGSTPEIAAYVDALYRRIITVGTHPASSIRVAEAAKVIENTQRDVNIALINELALIFNRLDIDTEEVLQAAESKWNFLPFRPGLVGGHCIGVDPYYLTHKAQAIGYHPEIILAGRRLNDRMGAFVASEVIKLLTRRGALHKKSKILILGLTFKENCPDLRNTRVIDIVHEFQDYGLTCDVHDPWANPEEALQEYGLTLVELQHTDDYDAIVIAVAHHQFATYGVEKIRALGTAHAVLYDVKHLFPKQLVDGRL
jgi:UDP-N-acetyl-D-galactosamine dehydrogenase